MDTENIVPDKCFEFIEKTILGGSSVVVCSKKGKSRSCTVLAAYIMRKYRWTLLKSLEFLNSRIPDLEIRPNFLKQLSEYENRLTARGLGPKTSNWVELFDNTTNEFENEELFTHC